ncbi:MarR family winged helix-turn-helix transcriptional regulator [uncultured Veillonella sp.]|uniref:MarR family winged helix-turn-helix transcriptional regulator n=1 Tax=uncultured Veillonella sp. TaxID=159268 RepID=UPI00262944CB|nr:MarR family transcriptional regulator [uncultured Veillonella sp.]
MTDYFLRWFSDYKRVREISEALEHALESRIDLSLNAYYVLHFLAQAEEHKLRLNNLQEQVGLSQSAMSRMILRMEDVNCGCIERRLCSCDKRGVYIGITEHGLEKLAKAEPIVQEVLHSFYSIK